MFANRYVLITAVNKLIIMKVYSDTSSKWFNIFDKICMIKLFVSCNFEIGSFA